MIIHTKATLQIWKLVGKHVLARGRCLSMALISMATTDVTVTDAGATVPRTQLMEDATRERATMDIFSTRTQIQSQVLVCP